MEEIYIFIFVINLSIEIENCIVLERITGKRSIDECTGGDRKGKDRVWTLEK